MGFGVRKHWVWLSSLGFDVGISRLNHAWEQLYRMVYYTTCAEGDRQMESSENWVSCADILGETVDLTSDEPQPKTNK